MMKKRIMLSNTFLCFMFYVITLTGCSQTGTQQLGSNSNLDKVEKESDSLKVKFRRSHRNMDSTLSVEIEYDTKVRTVFSQVFYENGNLKSSVMLIEWGKEGELLEYYENGTIKQKSNWIDNEEDGVVYFYYSSGNLAEETQYKKGKQHGFSHKYFENGKLAMEGRSVKGKREGEWIYYNEQGEEERRDLYVGGDYQDPNE